MASYQDIETRLQVVERKLDFLMGMGQVTKKTPSLVDPSGFTIKQLSLTDLYHELNSAGASLEAIDPKETL